MITVSNLTPRSGFIHNKCIFIKIFSLTVIGTLRKYCP